MHRPLPPASLLPVTLLLAACPASPPANPEFTDAAAYTLSQFEAASEADLAFALRQFERELYLSADLDAQFSVDRSVVPDPLTEADLEGYERPDRDPGAASGIGVIARSAYAPEEHGVYILLPDQTPVEPSSPDHYDRTFVEGEDCWLDRSCSFLRTENNLTTDNAILTVTYDLKKDYRWVDMSLPDPADGPDAEPVTADGQQRWAFAARSWTLEEAEGNAGANSILQSYSIEVWIPRDGRGFLRDGSETNVDDGVWDHDSEGGGTLRSMVLWSESEISITDDEQLIVNTTRTGIDDIFDTQEEWLDAQR